MTFAWKADYAVNCPTEQKENEMRIFNTFLALSLFLKT